MRNCLLAHWSWDVALALRCSAAKRMSSLSVSALRCFLQHCSWINQRIEVSGQQHPSLNRAWAACDQRKNLLWSNVIECNLVWSGDVVNLAILAHLVQSVLLGGRHPKNQ